jgi:hypothetical protein
MAVNNKPQDDAKVMKDEYVKGATIDDIALKYNHSSQEVADIVVTEATDEDQTVLQADQEEAEAKPAKKGK